MPSTRRAPLSKVIALLAERVRLSEQSRMADRHELDVQRQRLDAMERRLERALAELSRSGSPSGDGNIGVELPARANRTRRGRASPDGRAAAAVEDSVAQTTRSVTEEIAGRIRHLLDTCADLDELTTETRRLLNQLEWNAAERHRRLLELKRHPDKP